MSALHPFRSSTPNRTYKGPVYSSYRRYKEALAADFNRRCGYTDSPDFWFGGPSAFHIDHFKPKSKYAALECDYNNLVYACSHVNQAKSDDDATEYLDPCNTDYNEHFGRDQNGNIVPLLGSPEASYMYKKLKLYLRRYGVIWALDQLGKKIDELHALLEQVSDAKVRNEVLEEQNLVAKEYRSYMKYLSAIQ